jgi:hypothetical protein
VIEEAKTVPVVAAGGIANGAQIRRALLAGACGVLIGTRFVATKEAGAPDGYKGAITRAKAADTVLTVWVTRRRRQVRRCHPHGRLPIVFAFAHRHGRSSDVLWLHDRFVRHHPTSRTSAIL